MRRSLRSRVRSWGERLLARWRVASRARPVGPYRVAAPPPRSAPPRVAHLRSAVAAMRMLWSAERLRWIACAAGVGLGSSGLLLLLVRCARFAAPRVSTPVTHVLAIPFGLLVGLVAAAVFLAFGAAIMAVGALALVSIAHGLAALARASWHLLVVWPRELLAGSSER